MNTTHTIGEVIGVLLILTLAAAPIFRAMYFEWRNEKFLEGYSREQTKFSDFLKHYFKSIIS